MHVADGFVRGWAFDPLRPTLKTSLSVDGVVLADGLTGHTVADEFYAYCVPPATDCGFVLPLPAQALDGLPHQLVVKVADWHPISTAPQSTLTWRHGDNFGEIGLTGQGFIEGWVGFRDLNEGDKLPDIYVVDDAGQARLIKLTAAGSSSRPEFRSMAHFKVSREQLAGLVRPVYQCRGIPLKERSSEPPFKSAGQLESVDYQGIRGWALNASNFLETLDLVLVVDGLPLTVIRPNIRRYDIAAHLGLLPEEVGIAGFHIGLPAGLKDGDAHTISIQCRRDGTFLEPKSLSYRHPGRGNSLSQVILRLGRPALLSAHESVDSRRLPFFPVVSIIILNRNGAACLESLFQSWLRHNSTPVEIIVIDHASSDDSRSTIKRWESRLPIHTVALDSNDSFSASCNRGARLARGEFVLFLNNDIVWQHDALPALVQTLQDPKVGLVGLKLLKTGFTKEGRENTLPSNAEVQHLGVRFTLVDGQYWPYEVTPEQGLAEAQFSPQDVPAVTGAVMLCRREAFLKLGGFNEAYFYGYEDVEFCLRLHQQTGERIVCRNDLVALHHHGYTRLTGREPAVFDRQQDNQKLLAGQLGLWVKRAWWQNLTDGDKQLTSEVLTIGFAVHDTGVRSGQLAQAVALAESVVSLYPAAECVFLSQDKDWSHTAHLHVLISFTPLFDLRNLRHPRADLRTACFIDEQSIHEWLASPCLDRFDICLCGDRELSGKLVERLPPGIVPTATSAQAPLGALLDSKLLRVLLRVPDSLYSSAAARKIRAGLKQQGALVADVGTEQWHSLHKVVDVVITLHGQSEESLPHFDRREEVINIIWLLDSPETFKLANLALADELWVAGGQIPAYPGRMAKKQRKVEIEEKQLKGIARILRQIVEERVERTFCAS